MILSILKRNDRTVNVFHYSFRSECLIDTIQNRLTQPAHQITYNYFNYADKSWSFVSLGLGLGVAESMQEILYGSKKN